MYSRRCVPVFLAAAAVLVGLLFSGPSWAMPDILFEDFEGTLPGWTATGNAFTNGPVAGTLPYQSRVLGYHGQRLINSFLDGDGTQGALLSPSFTLSRRYVYLLVGGGRQPGLCAVQLLVDGVVCRSSSGLTSEELRSEWWDVSAWSGRQACIRIVDQASDAWGHVLVDYIVFTDGPTGGDLVPARSHRKFLFVPLRFSDTLGTTPHPLAYYQALTGWAWPGVSGFFAEESYGRVDFEGSQTWDYVNLPLPARSYQSQDGQGKWYWDFSKLLDAFGGIYDAQVDFQQWDGVMFFPNVLDETGGGAFTWVPCAFDGFAGLYAVGWLNPTQGHSVLVHELGHDLGIGHLNTPTDPWDNPWGAWNDTYAGMGTHHTAFHKMVGHWCSPWQIVRVEPGGDGAVVRVERSALPSNTSDARVVVVPFQGETGHYYTIEARRRAGFDQTLFGEGVVIHDVQESRADRECTLMVPPGVDLNVNPGASAWQPGQTFTDATNAISVQVNAQDATGYLVTVTNNSMVVSGFTVAPTSVTGGLPATGTVTLSKAAPAGGTVVTLRSSSAAVAGVPASVTIPAGSKSASFPVTTTGLTITTAVALTATYGVSTCTATLTVQPPALASLALDASTVVGSAPAGGTVTLNAPAPLNGLGVGLDSDTPDKAGVPISVMVPGGQTTAHFVIATQLVTARSTVGIRAACGGVARTAVLTLLPGTSQPDLLVKRGADSDTAYATAGTYQTAPAGTQVVGQEVAPGTPAAFQVKVVNAGTTTRTFVLRAVEAAGISGWGSVAYRTGPGAITTQMRSTAGYTTPSLSPSESLVVTVKATPAADVPGGTCLSAALRVFLDAADATVRDAVQAVATVARPDLLVRPASDASYSGDGLYQGAPAGAQVCRQTVPPGVKASYQVKLENESAAAHTFVLKATEAGSGWYVSYRIGATDVTAKVRSGAGFTTPAVPANGSVVVDVALTPLSTLPAGATKSATLRVFLNGTDTQARDAVQVVAVVDRPRPDLLVKRGGEPDTAYASNNVYQVRPAGDQIERQTVVPGTPAAYHVKVQNDGHQPRTYVLKAVETAAAGWSVLYRLGGEDVSAQVKSPAGMATPETAGGGQIVLTVEVNPGPAVLPNLRASVIVNAFLDATDTTVRDSVQALTTAGVLERPDLLIKKASETTYAGDGLYQAVPAGAQVLSQPARTTVAARFTVRMQNDGNTSRAFVVKAVESPQPGWSVLYRYGATDITARVKGAGWTTPVLTRCTGSTFLTVDLKPLAGTTGEKSATLRVFLNGTDVVVRDAVQAVATVGIP